MKTVLIISTLKALGRTNEHTNVNSATHKRTNCRTSATRGVAVLDVINLNHLNLLLGCNNEQMSLHCSKITKYIVIKQAIMLSSSLFYHCQCSHSSDALTVAQLLQLVEKRPKLLAGSTSA